MNKNNEENYKKDVLDYAYENFNLEVYPKTLTDIPVDILEETLKALEKCNHEQE